MDWKSLLTSGAFWVNIVIIVGGVVGLIFGAKSAIRKAQIELVVRYARNLIRDLSAIEPAQWETTADGILGAVDAELQSLGWDSLSSKEQAAAKLSLQRHLMKKPTPLGARILASVSSAAKVLAVLLVLGLASSARADGVVGGWDWSTGATVPFMEYDIGKPQPLQVAPGAGVQVSVTREEWKQGFAGRSWDLLDLTAMAFGSVVSSSSGQQFGTLSAALAVCTLSSLLCVGAGKHIISADNSFTGGGWFFVLALSVNVALTPTAPSYSGGGWWLPRANTLYFAGGQ
jgi:hypothetical protein